MILIYHNYSNNNYIEFSFASKHGNAHYFINNPDLKVAAKNMIDDGMKYILEFGGSIEFPQILLECFLDNEELDIFLLAGFDKRIREKLESYLYVESSYEHRDGFIGIKTNNYISVEAIGKNSMIMYQELSDGNIKAKNISFEDLESSFIQL